MGMGGEEDDDPGWHLDFLLHVVEIRGLRL